MNVTEAINSRRAVREFTAEPVDEELLRQLIDAATQAPNFDGFSIGSNDVTQLTLWGDRISNCTLCVSQAKACDVLNSRALAYGNHAWTTITSRACRAETPLWSIGSYSESVIRCRINRIKPSYVAATKNRHLMIRDSGLGA